MDGRAGLKTLQILDVVARIPSPCVPVPKGGGVVDGLNEMGVRDKVKVIIGGGQVDEHAGKFMDADAWVTDALAGVK